MANRSTFHDPGAVGGAVDNAPALHLFRSEVERRVAEIGEVKHVTIALGGNQVAPGFHCPGFFNCLNRNYLRDSVGECRADGTCSPEHIYYDHHSLAVSMSVKGCGGKTYFQAVLCHGLNIPW